MTGFDSLVPALRKRLRATAVGVVLGVAAFVAAGPTGANAAITTAPVLTSPSPGATLTSFGPTLTWSNPGGVTQYHLQVVPANNDGPGVDVHVGELGNSFDIPAPPAWYGLLPDMTYTWRVRVSDAATFLSLTDPSWSPFAEAKFRTPKVPAPASPR